MAILATLSLSLTASPAPGFEIAQGSGPGAPLHWCPGARTVWVHAATLPCQGLGPHDLADATRAALASWNDARCAGSPALHFGGERSGALPGWWAGGSNSNLVACADPARAASAPPAAVAQTTLTYRIASGELLDVDVEVFGDRAPLSVAEQTPAAAVDLQGTVTHELGHALGLGHSTAVDSVMGNTSTPGPASASLRELRADDRAGLCALGALALELCEATSAPSPQDAGPLEAEPEPGPADPDTDGCHLAPPAHRPGSGAEGGGSPALWTLLAGLGRR